MSATSVERLLGGAGVVRGEPSTPGEWIELVRRGLPAAAVDSIAKAVGLSQAELCQLETAQRSAARRIRRCGRAGFTADWATICRSKRSSGFCCGDEGDQYVGVEIRMCLNSATSGKSEALRAIPLAPPKLRRSEAPHRSPTRHEVYFVGVSFRPYRARSQ
ncbi:MAG: antitoxin Xre-like helix-turn-helix domain-containing protein [Burkholderiales bacterium]